MISYSVLTADLLDLPSTLYKSIKCGHCFVLPHPSNQTLVICEIISDMLSQLECSYRCVVSDRFSIWEKGWRKNNFHCFVVYFDQIIIKIYKEIYTDNRYNFRSDYFNKYWAYLHFWGRTQCFSIPYLGRGGVCPLLYLPLTIELCIDLTKCIGWL